ncbi:hypothetical protein HED60_21405 [Planctomycetales bacterium ZRK34]|nr:hypothetical protein HED60_21405 [Planctomycetales bacterium ZRK34]
MSEMLSTTEQAALRFCESHHWHEAIWLATAYQWHPTSKMPPVLGLVFADGRKGIEIFRTWTDAVGNVDENDDLRVAIIEGDMPGQTAGYTVRLSPSLNEYLDEDDTDRRFVGRVVRMHPQFGNPEAPDMLARFKQEYQRHGEFMLPPVVQRDDGELYMDVHHGIIKRELVLRHVSDISDDEPDMLSLRECDDEKIIRRAAASIDTWTADENSAEA